MELTRLFPSDLRVGASECTDFMTYISGRNIAFCCSNLLDATEEELMEALGAPQVEPVARKGGKPLDDGLPTQLVEAASWIEWVDEDYEDIRLLDFGESFLQGEEPERLAQPGKLRVPETIFTKSFDHRLDLWRVGCTVSGFIRPVAMVHTENWNPDLLVPVHRISVLLPWRGRGPGFSNDQICGEAATRMAIKVGRNAREL